VVSERRIKVGYDLSRPGTEWEFSAELQAVDKRGRRLPKAQMAWGLGGSPGEAAVNCIEDIQKWLNSELAVKFEDGKKANSNSKAIRAAVKAIDPTATVSLSEGNFLRITLASQNDIEAAIAIATSAGFRFLERDTTGGRYDWRYVVTFSRD
jgi:hypothetical protein